MMMHPKSEQARVMSHLIFANKNNFMAIDIYARKKCHGACTLERETTLPLSPKKCHRQQKAPMTHHLQDCRLLLFSTLVEQITAN
jgi:hypothetical protein